VRPQQRKSKSSRNYLPEYFEQRLLLSAVAAAPSAVLTSHVNVPAIEQDVVSNGLPEGPPFGGGGGSATPPSGTYTPQQIESAYSASGITLNGGIVGNGAGQTIAIVDAYNYPTALTDLQAFDAFYGLANPPSFEVVNQEGLTSPLPGDDPAGEPGQGDETWESEESLDIEWSHAMAPGASIILVEANDDSNNLFAAAAEAARLPGVSVVSDSWSQDESGSDGTLDSTFATPSGHQGVTFVFAAGDAGAFSEGTNTLDPQYPDTSPDVVSVGGTTLTINGDTYGGETVWGEGAQSGTAADGGGGGGISTFEPQPAYQHLLVTQSSTFRTYPDVAMEGDPNTGVAEYDSYDNGSADPWVETGGTSLATPLFAGALAIVNQARTLNGMGTLNGETQTLPLLYSLPEADFHDITSGSNGYSAGPGYDLGSGRGSVIVSKLVADLSSTYIGSYVFDDTNFNGVQDTGEAGAAGVTVELLTPGSGGIGSAGSNVVQTTTTDTYGLYEFTGMAAGTYYVHVVTPAGYDFSPVGTSAVASENSVVDQNGNSGLITVTGTTDNNLVNVGIYQASISINNVTITRPHSGLEAMTFTVTLSPTDPSGASVPYTTEDGTATVANDDYIATSGTLVFPAGVTTETITVEAVGNMTIENNVSYTVNLTAPAGFDPVQTVGTGTILNSNFPAVTVTSPTAQTRSGTASLTYAFTVQLSEPAPFAVTVPYTTTDASAVGGVDYTSTSGTLIFPAGTTGPQTIDVTVLPGTNPQLDKTFYLTLEASSTVVLGTPSQGVGTILTNSPPSISAEPGSVIESLSGLTYLPFNVEITPSLTGPVTISYATSNGTAVAGVDYQSEAGTLTFTAGRVQETVYVPVYQQFIAAQTKTVNFTISNPDTNILIATAASVGTITYQPLTALPFSNSKRATYTDSLNQRVFVSLKGLGSGDVVFIGNASSQTNAFEIVTNGTNSASALTVSVAGAKQTALTSVVVNGSIGTISAKTVNILSSVTSTSSMYSLSLGYMSASTITIGGANTGQSVALSFNRVLNSTISSAIPIRSLTASAYLDTTGSPTYINAPSVGQVKVKGNFGGTIKTTSLASLLVGGLIDSGGVLATGTIGTVTADGIINSSFLAGVGTDVSGIDAGGISLPTSASDFVNLHSSIASIRVNGGVFSNSLIAGWDIGSVSVADIGTDSGAANFGISANHVGKIHTGGIGTTHKVLSLVDPTTTTAIDNFIIEPV
jgi:subtilase family serine protease